MTDKACKDAFEQWWGGVGNPGEHMTKAEAEWAFQAAWNRRAPEVPEGWKLVPVESTWEMDHEGMLSLPDDCHDSDAERCYRAMIAAAPRPPKDAEV